MRQKERFSDCRFTNWWVLGGCLRPQLGSGVPEELELHKRFFSESRRPKSSVRAWGLAVVPAFQETRCDEIMVPETRRSVKKLPKKGTESWRRRRDILKR